MRQTSKPTNAINDPARLTRVLKAFPLYSKLGEVMLDQLFSRQARPRRVLELGSATGVFASQLKDRAAGRGLRQLVCLEPMDRFYHHSRKAHRRTLQQYPLEHSSSRPYDAVLARLTYHHIPPEEKTDVLGHVRDLLAPDGLFIIGDMFLPTYAANEGAAGRGRAVVEFYLDLIERTRQMDLSADLKELIIGDFIASIPDEILGNGEFKEPLQLTLRRLKCAGLAVKQIEPVMLLAEEGEAGFYVLTAKRSR